MIKIAQQPDVQQQPAAFIPAPAAGRDGGDLSGFEGFGVQTGFNQRIDLGSAAAFHRRRMDAGVRCARGRIRNLIKKVLIAAAGRAEPFFG